MEKTEVGTMKHFVAVRGVRVTRIQALVECFRRESIPNFELAMIHPVTESTPALTRGPARGSGIRPRGPLGVGPSAHVAPLCHEAEGCLQIMSLSIAGMDASAFDAALRSVAQRPVPPDILALDLFWPNPDYLDVVRRTVPSSVGIFLRLSWQALLRISESTAVYSHLLGRYANSIAGVWFDCREKGSWVNSDAVEPFIQRADDSGVHAVISVPTIDEARLTRLLRDHPDLSLDLAQPADALDEADLERFANILHELAITVTQADAERKRLASSV